VTRKNYSFEKRQRELAKKKKQETKRQEKAEAQRIKAEGIAVGESTDSSLETNE
jgi:hypothetical protein